MDTTAHSPTPGLLVPCGTGCRYAEPLRGDYRDWVWCTRPAATHRVRSTYSDCRWFTPPARSDSLPAR